MGLLQIFKHTVQRLFRSIKSLLDSINLFSISRRFVMSWRTPTKLMIRPDASVIGITLCSQVNNVPSFFCWRRRRSIPFRLAWFPTEFYKTPVLRAAFENIRFAAHSLRAAPYPVTRSKAGLTYSMTPSISVIITVSCTACRPAASWFRCVSVFLRSVTSRMKALN